MSTQYPNDLPPEEEPPQLALVTKTTKETCVECNTIVSMNYVVHLGRVYCVRCATAEGHV